ncbi:MAG: hypothetical protein ACTSQY_06485 [Candidatus Odinarchaeia archaeon]
MENLNYDSIKQKILSGLYGGDIIVIWSDKKEDQTINWKPMDFIKVDPHIVYDCIKQLVKEGLIKTFEKNGKVIYHLSYSNEEIIREQWFNYVYSEVDRKLSPVLNSISLKNPPVLIIKPKWND